MPSLDREAQDRLRESPALTCLQCRQPGIRDYCRECDEFFRHCDCPSGHDGHRTYEALVRGADVALERHESFFGFRPHTRRADDWVRANVPGAQWISGMLVAPVVEGERLLTAMSAGGLKVLP